MFGKLLSDKQAGVGALLAHRCEKEEQDKKCGPRLRAAAGNEEYDFIFFTIARRNR